MTKNRRMTMFGIGSRIVLWIRGTRPGSPARVALPGVVVSAPFQSSFTSRSGAVVPQQRATIVTLRESADGRLYAKTSDESLVFLTARGGELVKGLDVDPETGEILSTGAIRTKAAADLQQFLATQAVTMTAVAEQTQAYQGEPLAPAPVA
jgi:hypothetical protein